MNLHKIYLAVGGNLGDRRQNLQTAIGRLRAGGFLRVERVANLYETDPVGYEDQPRFLNTALEARTDLEPLELLDYLKEVEVTLGRQPTFQNGPRPLDLDLIFYDDLVFDRERLQIPHPRLRGRGFVLAPLAELCPDYTHPGLGLTVQELLAEVDLRAEGVEPYQAEPRLEIPRPAFLFVTGQLAQGWLEDFLAGLAERLDFDYRVAALDIDVAAFMTCRFIADRLKISSEERQTLDWLIVPGFAGGDLTLVEKTTGVRTLRGPTDLTEITPFLAELLPTATGPTTAAPFYYNEAQLRAMQTRLTDPNIRIYTDGTRIFAFNNAVFGAALPTERELRTLFRLFKIDNAAHAYYLGREFHKAAVSLQLGRRYRQDREIEGL